MSILRALETGWLGPIQAVGLGALTVGLLEAIDAMVFYGLYRGVAPTRDLSVNRKRTAGPRLISGWPRDRVARGAAAFLYRVRNCADVLSGQQKVEFLARTPAVAGTLDGVLVYFIMNRVVLPLSAVGTVPFALPTLLNGIMGHALLVGLPAAFFARAGSSPSLSRAIR